MLGYNEALAIRWNDIPGVPFTKAELFARLSGHKDKCCLSATREMQQKNSKVKGVRCIVVKTSAFSDDMCSTLRKGKNIHIVGSYKIRTVGRSLICVF